MMQQSVFYAELTPAAFRERIAQAPIAYLPLGTLEWHGEHLPFGTDGLIAAGFLADLARRVGGIVLPMFFLGPDIMRLHEGQELYGMDFTGSLPEASAPYPAQQLDGSAYWIPDDVYFTLLTHSMRQLKRAGFRVVVAHGHGPSTMLFSRFRDYWREKYDLVTFDCWGPEPEPGLGIQVDHAAKNETSLVMALHPDLVRLKNLPADLAEPPVGVGGDDPRVHASAAWGERAIAAQVERMTTLLATALTTLSLTGV